MATIKRQMYAYLTNIDSLDRFLELLEMQPKTAAGILFYSTNKGMETEGWTLVGMAEVEVTITGQDQLIQNAVHALKSERKEILTKAMVKAEELNEKIQNLLALPAPKEDGK